MLMDIFVEGNPVVHFHDQLWTKKEMVERGNSNNIDLRNIFAERLSNLGYVRA